jgi:hypothetical protein
MLSIISLSLLFLISINMIVMFNTRKEINRLATDVFNRFAQNKFAKDIEFRHFYLANTDSFLESLSDMRKGFAVPYIPKIFVCLILFIIDLRMGALIIAAYAFLQFMALCIFYFQGCVPLQSKQKEFRDYITNYQRIYSKDNIWQETRIDEFGMVESTFYEEKLKDYLQEARRISNLYLGFANA